MTFLSGHLRQPIRESREESRSLVKYMGLKKMNTLVWYVKTNEKVTRQAIGMQ